MLDDLGYRRGYCHLKEKTLDCILSGGIVLKETVDLSSDRLLMMMMMMMFINKYHCGILTSRYPNLVTASHSGLIAPVSTNSSVGTFQGKF
jgi:hypothetical protein